MQEAELRFRGHADTLAAFVAKGARVRETRESFFAKRVCGEGAGVAAEAGGFAGGGRVVRCG